MTQQFTATGLFGGTGGTGDVTAITVWTSSDPSIASINANGTAIGLQAGAVTISGDCQCYVSRTTLTVSDTAVSLTSIEISPANPTLQKGATQQFTATGTYSNGKTADITSQVTWASSDNAVATVSSAGLATALTSGETTISAVSGSVQSQTTLTVP